jgi:asparagine synthase (glutamine-hydrolysing)
MSGIAGIFQRDGRSVRQSDIQEMLSAIAFRGPDGQGIWTNGAIGLGHCILRTTPESVYETQPFKNTNEDLVISADARIDNRDELISLLDLHSRQPLLLSDSELILTAYEKWGEHCVEKLLGDFAFAVWDKRQQQVYCAVDHFRRKPLCYCISPGSLVFSSQISGLLPGKLVPKKINDIRLGTLFFEQLGELDKTTTSFKDIYQLPPASYLLVNNQSMTIREYWNPDEIKNIQRTSDAEYQEEFTALLNEAVRCRLRSNGATAIAMSGGIDSISIAALSNSLFVNDDNKLMSISGLSGNEADSIESGYVRKAVSALGTSPVLLTPDMLKDACKEMVSSMKNFDSPMAYQNIFLIFLFNTARVNHAGVLLTGADGDTLLGLGSHYIAHLVKDLEIKTAIREAVLRGRNTENYSRAWFGILLNAFRGAFLPNFSRSFTYKIRNRLNYKKMLKTSLINPSFAERIDLIESLSEAQEQAGFGLTSSINTMRIRTFNRPFISWMSVSMDMMGGAFSLDLRHPYQDKQLITYCLGLPWDQKNRDGWEKYILRKAMQDRIPDEIRWRKIRDETGWEYVKKFAHLIYPEIESIINDKNNRIFEYFDYTGVQEAVKKYNNAEWNYGCIIRIYGLHNWLSTKIEK